jgi:hypothetical protein
MLQKETDKHDMGFAGEAVFSAKELSDYATHRRQAELARDDAREHEAAKAREEQIKRLMTPIEITKERIATFMARLRQAADQGQSQILVLRFPSDLCTDRGRAINNSEQGWEQTLVGMPKQLVEAWSKSLKPLGFGLHAEVIDYPNGMPGDIGLYCSW